MRFFTAVSVAFAALAGVASAQATATGTGVAPPAQTDGTSMRANAITGPVQGDSITAGEDYTITWTNTVGDSVTLVLVGGPSSAVTPVATIVANIDNTGSYTWSVPENIPASDSYSIRISYDSNPTNWNYSDRFPFSSDVTASASVTTAASTTTEESSTSTEESSTESETTTESESSTITSAPTTSSQSTSMSTSTSRRATTTTDAPEETSSGAPDSAASSNLASPAAIIMALIAAAAFIH